MVDEIATVHVSGLNPNEKVKLAARLSDGQDVEWIAEAGFAADSNGEIDTSKQPALSGSYSGVSSMGLVWSMKPNSVRASSYQSPPGLGTQRIEFQLKRDDKLVATTSLEQAYRTGALKRVELEGQILGTLFLPGENGPYPGVMVLGGSEGGIPTRRAAWLASHGYAALALAYFRYGDLPRSLEAIPLEYFQAALSWMMQRSEISPDRIAVLGTSRGAELALQLGSMFPQIRAVVAYVPSNVRFPSCCGANLPYAWTWQGRPLAFVTRRELNNLIVAEQARICVELTHGPVLVISGNDDKVWDSSSMSSAIDSRLKEAKFSYAFERLNYLHAGHRAGRPEIVPTWHRQMPMPETGREEVLGGTVEGDAASTLDAIPKVLAFLAAALDVPTPATK